MTTISPLTGAEIKTLTESILDDTVDDVLFYQLLNVAKDTLEDERAWAYLKKLDATKTAEQGRDYTTSIALPSDWRRTYKLMVGKDYKYMQVPFDEQHLWRFNGNRFCVDVANESYYLLGTVGASDTIYHYYIKQTDVLDADTAPSMPARFHTILAFIVAGYVMMGVDADDIFARMSPENKIMAQTIKASMIAWDTQLQMDSQNNSIQVDEAPVGIDVGLM